jgi:hypothetical protein
MCRLDSSMHALPCSRVEHVVASSMKQQLAPMKELAKATMSEHYLSMSSQSMSSN